MDAGKFIWTVGDRQYVLVPEVRGSEKRWWVMGAGMYDLDGEYIGYWHRGQMPIPLIHGLLAHWKASRPDHRLGSRSVAKPDRSSKTRKLSRKGGF